MMVDRKLKRAPCNLLDLWGRISKSYGGDVAQTGDRDNVHTDKEVGTNKLHGVMVGELGRSILAAT